MTRLEDIMNIKFIKSSDFVISLNFICVNVTRISCSKYCRIIGKVKNP